MTTPRSRPHALVAAAAGAALTLAPGVARAQEVSPGALDQIGRMISWSGVLTSLVVILAASIALRVLKSTVDSLGSKFVSQRLTFQKLATAVQFVLYMGTVMVVVVLSFNFTPEAMAVVGGAIVFSVGFAMKDLVASFVAGIMILVDRPFQVGDRVSFGGQYGDITAIGLRSVRLQTLDDNTVTIPNNKFLSELTSNGNYGALDMQVVVDFLVAPDQDVALARELVTEAAVTSNYVHLPKPVVVLVKQVIHESYVSIRLRLKAYVLDIRYEKAFETDVTLRVLEAFRDHGIQPPAMLHLAGVQQLARVAGAVGDAAATRRTPEPGAGATSVVRP